VLIKQGATARDLCALKGKSLAVPHGSWEHCVLFLERELQEKTRGVNGFFSQVTRPESTEDALDDVVDGLVDGVVVDTVSLSCYQRRKPARFAKLKEIQKSAVFPAAVVAYHAGAVDEATLTQFQKGMMNADKTAFGRQLLALWKLTAFEKVPENYGQSLKAIAQSYPPEVGRPVKELR